MRLKDYLGTPEKLLGRRILTLSKKHPKLEGTITKVRECQGDMEVCVEWDNGDKSIAWIHQSSNKLLDPPH